MAFWCAATAAMMLGACEVRQQPYGNAVNLSEPGPARQITLPQPRHVFDRERLLLAVAHARSLIAAGEDDRAAQQELDGQRFELRIRFGCGAPPTEERASNPSVRFNPEDRTVEVTAAPNVDFANPLVAQLAGTGVEAAEGFWLQRPWLLRPACGQGLGAGDAASPPQVGIAQFFTPDDSRVGRRNERSYTTLVRLRDPDDPQRPQGYDLVLAGRLRAGPAGRVIRCASPHPGTMPVCLISAEFDRVLIEDVEHRSTVAEWTRS